MANLIVMNKIYIFLKKHKNKINLFSILLILAMSFIYFIFSKEPVYLKTLVFLLSALAYIGIFFGVRFVIYLQNKIKPLPEKAQKIFAGVIMGFAMLQTVIQLSNFVWSFNSFHIILCSVFLALLCVFVYLT